MPHAIHKPFLVEDFDGLTQSADLGQRVLIEAAGATGSLAIRAGRVRKHARLLVNERARGIPQIQGHMKKRSECSDKTKKYLADLRALADRVEEACAYYEHGPIPRPELAVVLYDTNEFIKILKKLIIDFEAQMFRDRGLVAEALAKRYERFERQYQRRMQADGEAD